MLGISGGAFVLYIIAALVRNNTGGINLLRTVLLYSMLLSFGWLISYSNDIRHAATWYGHTMNTATGYTARITDEPAEKERTWKVQANVIDAIDAHKVVPATSKVFIYVYKDAAALGLHKGDTILLPNKWVPLKNSGNPYEFDYARFCRHNNIFHQQFLAAKDISLYSVGSTKDITLVTKTHDWCIRQLALYIPDSAASGLIQAMLLGDEVNMDPHMLQAYADTGIVHIIAISGGNVGIFFLVISALLFWLSHKKYHWIKYLIALPLVWFYVVMAGAPPSAIRAALMFSLLGIGYALQKEHNSLNQLFATAFVLLCVQPMWLYSVGFQLSFIAVLSLILFYYPIYKLVKPSNIILRNLWMAIAASLAAEILAAPLVIYYFHLFPLLFIIANMLAYIFMGIVLVLGMLVIVCSPLPMLAKFLAMCTTGLVTIFNKVVYGMQHINPASFHFLVLNNAELMLLYITIGSLAFFIMKKKKSAIFISGIALIFLLCSFCCNEWIAVHQDRLVVYNISKINHIERITGKYHTLLNSDTLADSKKNYILKPAHTYWHAWKQKQPTLNKIIQIGKLKVLLLDGPVIAADGQHFPVDYVVVNYTNTIDPENIKNSFAPRDIILGSNHSRKETAKWIAAANNAGQPLFATANDGAFILNSN